MNAELFNRLKRLTKREGRVIIVEDSEAFVLMPLEEYESCMEDECDCGSSCRCHEINEVEEVAVKNSGLLAEDDKELLRKVNEDIARWRSEQSQKEEPIKENIEVFNEKEEEKGSLNEEERYYLEPLE
ncbi:MAG: hypothetical protein WC459_01355 [Patescibacteria group bacterium]